MMLRLGTRGSDLARTQSLAVAAALAAHDIECELTIIRTAGDASNAARFQEIGPQGVFVREIEQALIAHDIDLAVHSFKDLPSQSPPELAIAAVPERVDAADVLLLRPGALDDAALLALARGMRVGTASVRREAWLKHLRPDVATAPLRGNVPTRLGRLQEGRYDAILLAAAGLERLGASALGQATRAALAGLVSRRLDPEVFVPAPAQGALAIQCRAADTSIRTALAALNHAPSERAVAVERALLAHVQGGCDVAFGAHCIERADGYHVTTRLERAGRIVEAARSGRDCNALAREAWSAIEQALAQ
jgi:hydroxymethylbilane synthase